MKFTIVPAAQAQAPVDGLTRLSFDVASVKLNTSGNGRASQMQRPDGFTATNQTLRTLISIAYDVPLFRLSGGPDWTASERFDVAAKADHRITTDERRQMLRTLLEDRFMLKIRHETHEARIYALRLARADGQLGPNLRRRSLIVDCPAVLAARQRGEAPAATGKTGEPPDCIAFGGPGQFHASAIAIGSFALTLGSMMKETIVDRTGLTGSYDLEIQMNLDGAGPPSSDGSERPSIFTALKEQLGLTLEPQRGAVETFVIDSVEQPTGDE